MYKNTFFNEAYGATASVSLSQAVCLDFIRKNSKWHQLRQYFWQYCRLWKCFLLIEMLGSHHPEQVLKIWNILIGGVSLPLNLNHKCCKLLHSSCGSRRSAEFSCWSKKKKKKKRAGLKIKVWVKHYFTNFCCDSMKFYLWVKSFLCILGTCCIVMNSVYCILYPFLISYFHEMKRFSKNEKIKSVSKTLKF